jgi:hypothetical protein
MANYVKATNFTAKDSLASGNPSKIVKGTEIDTEFTAIASAVSSKADINSPALTGTPTAPTAITGTNTTQIATTAFVKTAIDNQSLGTIATQNANNVTITGGTITGITDLAVADGGTGSSTFTANSVVLGNGTSALNANMVAPSTDKNVLMSNGTTWTSAPVTALSTASGSAPSYSARMWVNFNLGTSTVRASGNVSSITYVSTAQAKVNFTTAMSDANYAAVAACDTNTAIPNIIDYNTAYVHVYFPYYNGPFLNPAYVSVAVFR